MLTLAALAGPFAMAQDAGGWYGGANIGQSSATIDDARITSGLLGQGLATSSISDRDRDAGYKLFGGYQFNRNFALEGGWFSLGKFGYSATTLPAGTLNGNIRLDGLNLDAVGILPVTDKLSVLGRVGLTSVHARDQFAATGAARVPYADPNPGRRQTNYKVGAGLMYDFTDALAMRIEAERYRINDAVGNKGHVDLVSVGLVYRFGGKVQAPAPRVVVAEPVAIAAAPVAVAPPPPPLPAPPAKVTFSADSLFDFNQATVKPAGKRALDKFASDLNGTRYDAVKVTGHTDRIGSREYNLKLSTRRAQAVSAYLVASAAIPADKIVAAGVGGAAPVTRAGECKGNRATPQLVACLQPDRRVDVEVSGTR
ncbi:MAG: OmpA/MotB [Variovorax sp.]|nr:OmpA/MotB [Variovorax sp.]